MYHNVEPILKKIKEKFKVATPLHLLIGFIDYIKAMHVVN